MRLIPVKPPFKFVEPVLVENPASAFYGMTHSKAVLIHQTLHGYRVRVQSENDLASGIDPEEAIFTRMMFPGDWATVMEGPYDLKLRKSAGVERVVSPQLVTMFEVVSKHRLLVCELCDEYREPAELVSEPEEFWGDKNYLSARLHCRDLSCQEGWL